MTVLVTITVSRAAAFDILHLLDIRPIPKSCDPAALHELRETTKSAVMATLPQALAEAKT